MTKKSHKRITRQRKENVGCMWGLISIFDFRRGRSALRLLSDKKCGSSRNLGINYSRNKVSLTSNIEENHGDAESITYISDAEAEEDDMVNSGVASFNTLRKKEMSRAHHSRRESNSKFECLKAELGIGLNAEINHKEATKSGVVGSENTLNSSDLDLGEFMLDYCNNGLYWERKQFEYENQTGPYPSPASDSDLENSEHDDVSATTLQKAIVDLTEAFRRENSNSSCENEEVHQPEGIVNVLEMLNSNKQLYVKLLKDPNSPIRKQIQEFQNIHFNKSFMPGSKKFQKLSGPNLIRKQEKLTVISQSNEEDDVKDPNRIVVLKPTKVRNQSLSNTTIAPLAFIRSQCSLENKEGGERPSSHFSLKELRKRFRNVIGASKREKHRIAMDGIMHKIPYGKQISRKNETPCRRERAENGGEKRSDTKDIQKNNESSIASKPAGLKKLSRNRSPRVFYTETAFCDEARKHLGEFLRIGNENESLSPIQVSKSLGRILSFPGFDHLSPRHNLAKEKKAETLQELLPYHSKLKKTTENLDLLMNKECFLSRDRIQEAENEILEIVGVEDKECIQIQEVSQLESQSVLIINEDDPSSGTFKEDVMMTEEESSILPDPEQSEAIFELSTPKDADCAIENAGRPSPISVLEPLYFEDVNIPKCKITEPATNVETETKPEQSQLDNSEAVSCSTDFEADLIACMEFDEAFLFDELEISYGFFIDDPKFLFDYIDEVLMEIKERHFSCTPWVSLIMKPTIWPKREYFMEEACRRINWHLDAQFPSTLKQAVKKDLDGRTWLDLQFDAESAVGEIGDAILDYLFEETSLELWD